MTALRFSVRWLLAMVALVGLGCAAIVYAHEWSAVGTWSVALAALGAATLVAVFRGRRAPFSLGFVVLAAMQLSLDCGPWSFSNNGSMLPTTRLASLLAHGLVPNVPLTYDDAWQRIGVDYDYGVSVTPTQAVASVNSQDPPAAIAMPDPCVMSSAAWSAMPADPSNWSLPGAQDVFRYWAIQQTGKALFVLLIGCTGGLAGVWIACRDASVSPPSRQ